MATGTRTVDQGAQGEPLNKQLKIRRMTMISLGGIIGAGLFFGSGPIINAVGPAAGLSVGRLYACFWIIVVAVEAQASAPILNAFFPSIPQWLLALGLMLLLTTTNPISVG